MWTRTTSFWGSQQWALQCGAHGWWCVSTCSRRCGTHTSSLAFRMPWSHGNVASHHCSRSGGFERHMDIGDNIRNPRCLLLIFLGPSSDHSSLLSSSMPGSLCRTARCLVPTIIRMLGIYYLPLHAPEHFHHVAGLDQFPLSSLQNIFLRDPGHTFVLECFVHLASLVCVRASFQFFYELPDSR